jgi:signal transduction histidine kinase
MQQDGQMVLTVADDGRGFDPDVPFAGDRRPGHNGLRNLYARARAMGGDAVLSSAPGKGTRLEFRLPKRLAAEGTDE